MAPTLLIGSEIILFMSDVNLPNRAVTDAQKLYEGKAKILYATDDPQVLLTYFKDDATAFNAQKRGTIVNKGQINCAVSTHLFKLLAAEGIPTHWLQTPSDRTMWVKPVTIVPLEVVVPQPGCRQPVQTNRVTPGHSPNAVPRRVLLQK
jgi:phosphoribosylaminoimidazole-succinocarboxamide synthase